MTDLLQRLRERKLVQWGLAYFAAAFALLQGLDLVAQKFSWPEPVMRFAIVIALIGFAITLVMAWYHGERGEQRASATELLIVALLLAIGGGLLWFVHGREPAGGHAPSAQQATNADKPAAGNFPAQDARAADEKSIAVLPLFASGGDSKDDYLGDGISEEVLNALSKLPGLNVIGRASSFQFRGASIDAAKVGRALNVRNLLAGTVPRAGDDLRITIELIDTVTGKQLWSERYDRTFKSLFALEDDISGEVRAALALKLGTAAGQPLVDVATTNPHAHDLYLRAKQLAYLSDEASLNQSVVLFNQAVAEDPNYAAAWAGLARTYAFLADAYRAPIDLNAAMRAAAEKAVALDPGLAEGHVYLGYLLMADEHDFPAARREAERGVALNPGSADAHMFLGLYWLQADHDHATARRELHIAEKLDPLNPWNLYTEMWAATAQGDFAAVLDLAQRVKRIDKTFFYLADPLVYAYAVAGRWRECVERSAQAQTAAGDQPDFAAAICHAHSGNVARAREILEQMQTAARTHYVDHGDIAAIHMALGEKDRALDELEQAYRDRSQPLLNFWFQPWFVPLHDEPRYRALHDRIYKTTKLPATTGRP